MTKLLAEIIVDNAPEIHADLAAVLVKLERITMVTHTGMCGVAWARVSNAMEDMNQAMWEAKNILMPECAAQNGIEHGKRHMEDLKRGV